MDLKLNVIPEHNYKCIVVPSEAIFRQVNDYKTITYDNIKYNIMAKVTVLRSAPIIPSSLLLLSIGVILSKETIYKKYKRSDRLYFFICDKHEDWKNIELNEK